MTAQEWKIHYRYMLCPDCGNEGVTGLEDGNVKCTVCDYVWQPDEAEEKFIRNALNLKREKVQDFFETAANAVGDGDFHPCSCHPSCGIDKYLKERGLWEKFYPEERVCAKK